MVRQVLRQRVELGGLEIEGRGVEVHLGGLGTHESDADGDGNGDQGDPGHRNDVLHAGELGQLGRLFDHGGLGVLGQSKLSFEFVGCCLIKESEKTANKQKKRSPGMNWDATSYSI